MANQQNDLYTDHTSLRAKPSSRDKVLADVATVLQAYREGLFGDTVHEVFPDLQRDSIAWRTYFSLPCAINYQRKSEGLWNAALATYNDPETRFVFDCRNVIQGFEAYQKALTKHKLALQPEKQSYIWFAFSKSILQFGKGDPDGFFRSFDYDVTLVKNFVKEHKEKFPYVSGPKLLNYWLYIYSYFVDVRFKNRDGITVIPDLHVKRATLQLGLVDLEGSDDTELVAGIWEKLLAGTDLAPCDLHGPLWRWSRAGFPDTRELRRQLESACNRE